MIVEGNPGGQANTPIRSSPRKRGPSFLSKMPYLGLRRHFAKGLGSRLRGNERMWRFLHTLFRGNERRRPDRPDQQHANNHELNSTERKPDVSENPAGPCGHQEAAVLSYRDRQHPPPPPWTL